MKLGDDSNFIEVIEAPNAGMPGIAFVCYFFAPMLCLLLSIALSRGEGASCK